jgi:hypothetical protein
MTLQRAGAKGAVSSVAWGNAPGLRRSAIASAESANHYRNVCD